MTRGLPLMVLLIVLGVAVGCQPQTYSGRKAISIQEGTEAGTQYQMKVRVCLDAGAPAPGNIQRHIV